MNTENKKLKINGRTYLCNRDLNLKWGESKAVPSGRAISIQQPFAELILRGKKKREYRSDSFESAIRDTVYIYASKTRRHSEDFGAAKILADEVPYGVIVGTIEIYGGTAGVLNLRNPRRFKKPLKTENQGQPCFFFPFGPSRSPRKGPRIQVPETLETIERRTPDIFKVKKEKKKSVKKKEFKGKVIASPDLAKIVGAEPQTRNNMAKKLINYIRANKLIWIDNKSMVSSDKILKPVIKQKYFPLGAIPTFVKIHSKVKWR